MYKAYKGRSVLVTGGAGFIGSHVSEKLIEAGAFVTILDNLSTGSLSNIEHFLPHVRFIEGDILDLQTCMQATQDASTVFHLAAVTSVPESVAHPRHCYEVNVMGTVNVLEAARICGVEHFVFSSSSAVYGTQSVPCTESLPCVPESPYGFSKLMGEQLCTQYAHNYGMHTVALRYFNVYGPRQNASGSYAAVVARFRERMSKNEPITIFGDGLQKRDFIEVSKVAEANLKMALLPIHEMQGAVCNVASGTSISLIELVENLAKEFPDFTAGIIFESARKGDIYVSQADCSRYYEIVQRIAAESSSLEPSSFASLHNSL
jgi:nucleoside-diphosphate-sugar epimerase